MNVPLLIRFEIEIPVHNVVSAPGLIFRQWFPTSQEDEIIIENDKYILKFWFDDTCIASSLFEKVEYSKQINVVGKKIFCDITVKDVKKELIEFLRRNIQTIIDKNDPLVNEAEELGKEVYEYCIKNLNSIIKFAKINKRQYWLEELPYDEEHVEPFNTHFKAKATEDIHKKKNWFRWRPIHKGGGITFVVTNEEDHFDRNDWEDLIEYLRSSTSKRTNFANELISKSRLLARYGYKTNAIIDLRTALEITVNDFVDNPDIKIERTKSPPESFKTYRKNLNISGFIEFLLPLIFSSEQLSKEVLENTLKANRHRQNIIHNRQRVITDNIFKLISSVEIVIKLLQEHTKKNGKMPH